MTAATEGATTAPSAARPADRVVVVCRDDLPRAVGVNAAAVLGLSVGHHLDASPGADSTDASGTTFLGITTLPIPVLVASQEELSRVFRSASTDERLRVLVLTSTAQRARTYEEYAENLSAVPDAENDTVALAVFGPRNRVTKHTKHLGLLGERGCS